MKFKIFAAALAALTVGALAQTASAQDFRGHNEFRTDWRRSGDEIVVRQNGRTMAFDRGDRLFYRLMDRPYNFVPGLTYAYTDDCDRFGCRVMVLAPRSHIAVDSLVAPRIFGRDWDRDARYDDRRHDEDQRYDDNRNYNDDDRLYGAPR